MTEAANLSKRRRTIIGLLPILAFAVYFYLNAERHGSTVWLLKVHARLFLIKVNFRGRRKTRTYTNGQYIWLIY